MNGHYAPPSMRKHKEIELRIEAQDVRIKTDKEVKAIEKFTGLLINPAILENMKAQSITKPTLVQKYVIPLAMFGDDLLICAPTGMGKTVSFLVPAINEIAANNQKKSQQHYREREHGIKTRVLILTPTRELAMQIHKESTALSRRLTVVSAVAYGGSANKFDQKNAIRKGADILIGTPGRLLDFLNRKVIDLSHIDILVLDEADRMLDMGFEWQLREIMARTNAKRPRQTMMFSATFPESVQKIAKDFFQQNLSEVHIGHGPLENITQELVYIDKDSHENLVKNKTLITLLKAHGYQATGIPVPAIARTAPRQAPVSSRVWGKPATPAASQPAAQPVKPAPSRIVIFVEMKVQCREVMEFLLRNGISCTSIHGDKDQEEREEALRLFTQGEIPILIATSVAARGLDIPNIRLVINYIMPSDLKDYIHRIGRTGRAGKKGQAITFLSRKDQPHAGALIEILKGANQAVPAFLEDLATAEPRFDRHRTKSFAFKKKGDKSGEITASSRSTPSDEPEEAVTFKIRDISTLGDKIEMEDEEDCLAWDVESDQMNEH